MIGASDNDCQVLLLPSGLHRFADLENDVIRAQRIVDLQGVSPISQRLGLAHLALRMIQTEYQAGSCFDSRYRIGKDIRGRGWLGQ